MGRSRFPLSSSSTIIWQFRQLVDNQFEKYQVWLYRLVCSHAFEKNLKSLGIVSNGLVIQGGSRGTILLVSLGMELDIIFKKISVKMFTCQLGSVLRLRCWRQGKLEMFLLMATGFSQLKYQIFRSNGGEGGILKFTLQWIIWWWQYESKESRVPLSRMRLGVGQ